MQLANKLSQTLAPPMGYSVREIAKWQSLRHPLFHADLQQATEIAIEADARTVVLRMEQAAWDILLNKAEWHSWSSARRALWDPPAITTNEAGHGDLRQGSKPTLEFLLLDEFGVFPRVFQIQHTNLPADWWHRFVADGGSVT